MSIFRLIPQFFENLSKRKFTQEQTEGMLDIITYVMLADGVTTSEERDQLERALKGVKWDGTGSPQSYVESAEKRLKNADDPHAFLERAATSIDTEELQDEVYFLAARMAGADDQLTVEETSFLHELTNVFGLDGERLRLLTQRLQHEGHV